jgi:alpha-amylase
MSTQNGVILQCFQWYTPGGGALWNKLKGDAAALAAAGFTSVWLPPAYKGKGGGYDVGYGVYDLFDLGEFPQKQTTATKYGTKQELVDAIAALRRQGLQVYADVVFNQKDGADGTEDVWAQEMDWDDRNRALSDWHLVKAWTRFEFPGRQGKYSTMTWYWWCFDAISFDQNHPELRNDKLFRIKGKTFSTEVSFERGNYDYLCGADCDLEGFVEGEFKYWGEWFLQQTSVDGFRLDAVKHIRSSFFPGWLAHVRGKSGRELFTVGEYWSGDVDLLHRYITATGGSMSLFDVPLHYRFRDASLAGPAYDLRTIFDRTLVKEQSALAVTAVDNHDTQPCQSLESWVQPWFKPHAYALILLRRDGYPCVFAGDYDPTSTYLDKGREVTLWSHRFLIDRFLDARRRFNFGDQHDYFDHPNTIAWIRTGDAQHPGAMAVVLTNGSAGNKWMNTFRPHATFRDVTGHIQQPVTTDANGWGNFLCPAASVSVWVH